MRITVNKTTGEWEPAPWNFLDSVLIAQSRTGVTQVWKLADGRLVEVASLKSGNVEANEVPAIPQNLTVRF